MNFLVLSVNLTFLPGHGNPEKAQTRLYQKSMSTIFFFVYFICQFSFFNEKKSPLVHYLFKKICLFLLVFLNVVVMSHSSAAFHAILLLIIWTHV